jgi:hypothetical protein
MVMRPQSRFTDAAVRQLTWAGVKTVSLVTELAQRARAEGKVSLPGFNVAEIVERLMSQVGFSPAVRSTTRKGYNARYPWVQPSPIHFDGLAPTVLNVPDSEIQEFLDVVVSRYVSTLRTHWTKAALYAWRNRNLEPVDDFEFVRLLQNTALSRFLNPTLDQADRAVFVSQLNSAHSNESQFYKVDLSAIEEIELLPGMYAAPSITLFEKRKGQSALFPRAIYLNGIVFEPTDGDAWVIARYYVLQGSALGLVLGIHPDVHFPMDAINALTKSIIPPTHLVRQCLEPHCYMQLPLNYAVLYINRSVAYNDQREIYTPFPCTKDGFFKVTRAFFKGIEGNSSYPPYRFELQPGKIHSEYGDFLSAYFELILDFTRKMTWGITSKDEVIFRWAEELSRVIPGFPNGQAIFDGDNLARAMAIFIWDVSVVHSADHYSYSMQSINQVPLRLRQPPPSSRSSSLDPNLPLIYWEDIFRHHMGREMYFKPSTVRRLVDVVYPFSQPQHLRLTRQFQLALRQLDAGLSTQRFAPLSEIACSIQY